MSEPSELLFVSQKFFVELKLAQQKQDQQNNNHKAEAAAPVVASTVKGAAADSTKAAQQRDHQNDEDYGPQGHSRISYSGSAAISAARSTQAYSLAL
jgi:hypothetical protein